MQTRKRKRTLEEQQQEQRERAKRARRRGEEYGNRLWPASQAHPMAWEHQQGYDMRDEDTDGARAAPPRRRGTARGRGGGGGGGGAKAEREETRARRRGGGGGGGGGNRGRGRGRTRTRRARSSWTSSREASQQQWQEQRGGRQRDEASSASTSRRDWIWLDVHSLAPAEALTALRGSPSSGRLALPAWGTAAAAAAAVAAASRAEEEAQLVWATDTEGDRRATVVHYAEASMRDLVDSTQAHLDDPDRHLLLSPGDLLVNRYRVVGKLGEGTFSRVYKCRSVTTDAEVAVKIIIARKRYKEAAFVELNTLIALHAMTRDMKNHIVEPLDWFMVGKKHVCVVFPCLGNSLKEELTMRHSQPFAVEHVRVVAWQCLCALAAIHNQGLIHTDLKPENICYLSDAQANEIGFLNSIDGADMVRLIDFGGATFHHSHHSRVITTQDYRAPEVLLNKSWSYGVDNWAMGCILYELALGQQLFYADSDREHLTLMDCLFGPFPRYMSFASARLADSDRDSTMRRWRRLESSQPELAQLLRSLLTVDPKRRITCLEALRLPFFRQFEEEFHAFEQALSGHPRLPPVLMDHCGNVSIGAPQPYRR